MEETKTPGPNWEAIAEQYRIERDRYKLELDQIYLNKQLLADAMASGQWVEPDLDSFDWEEIEANLGKHESAADVMKELFGEDEFR